MGRSVSSPMHGMGKVRPTLEPDVDVRRSRRALAECHQVVGGLTGQVDLGQAVVGEVMAGDAHALDLDLGPAFVCCVEAGRLSRLDPPELLLAGVLRVVMCGRC